MQHAVAACNSFGFQTIASCQGHLKHGCPYPWIDFDYSEDSSERFSLDSFLFKFNNISFWQDDLRLKVLPLGTGCRVQHYDFSKSGKAAYEVNPNKDKEILMRLQNEINDFADYLIEVRSHEV